VHFSACCGPCTSQHTDNNNNKNNKQQSVLAPLDAIAEFQLQAQLEPQLDARGGLALPDMSVKVTTTVTEQDVALPTRAPVADIVSGTGAATSSSSRQLALRNGNTNSASQAIGGSVRTPVKSAGAGAAAVAVAAANMMMSTLRSAAGSSTLLNGTGSPSAPRTPPTARTPTRCTATTVIYTCAVLSAIRSSQHCLEQWIV
jgi:hypothetical protein